MLTNARYGFIFLLFSFITYWGGHPLQASNFMDGPAQKLHVRIRTRRHNVSNAVVDNAEDADDEFETDDDVSRQLHRAPFEVDNTNFFSLRKVCETFARPFSRSQLSFPSIPLFMRIHSLLI